MMFLLSVGVLNFFDSKLGIILQTKLSDISSIVIYATRKFNFTDAVQEKIISLLKENYGDDAITVDTLARIQLEKVSQLYYIILKS